LELKESGGIWRIRVRVRAVNESVLTAGLKVRVEEKAGYAGMA
jgi:hypothetical protein